MNNNPADQLDREWLLLTNELQSELMAWSKCEGALRPFATLPALLGFLREGHDVEVVDPIMLALLRLASHDDDGDGDVKADDRSGAEADEAGAADRERENAGAARVVLQAVLPGLKARAEQLLLDYEEDELRYEEVWELLFELAWKLICDPKFQPPRNAAATLLRKTTRKTKVELNKRRVARAELDGGADPEWAATVLKHRDRGRYVEPAKLKKSDPRLVSPHRFVAMLDDAIKRGAISRSDAFLIEATRLDGISLRALSAHLEVPLLALRQRRYRAERRLLLSLGLQADVSLWREKVPFYREGADPRGAQIHPLDLARPLPDQAA